MRMRNKTCACFGSKHEVKQIVALAFTRALSRDMKLLQDQAGHFRSALSSSLDTLHCLYLEREASTTCESHIPLPCLINLLLTCLDKPPDIEHPESTYHSTINMPPRPTQATWTLRLKHHRTTILLHADKTQPPVSYTHLTLPTKRIV